jgi:leucyl/phenylalanyl-tRNA---protein transferase
MTIYLTELLAADYSFPSTAEALDEPNGLLAFGGDLKPERIVAAYHNGIFPWFGPGEPILWWSPSPRAVFNPKTFKPAKSVKKFQRKWQYKVSINHCTADVINLCASTRSAEQTWLNPEMRASYHELAKQGWCNSVEVWKNNTLIGGLYGLHLGALFCGESMFSLEPNASKIALWYFCQHFASHGGELIDCQVMNPHLQSLGALEIERASFIESLPLLTKLDVNSYCFQPQWLT